MSERDLRHPEVSLALLLPAHFQQRHPPPLINYLLNELAIHFACLFNPLTQIAPFA